MESVGTTLRHARMALGITQVELARSMGISPAFLNDIEYGRKALGEKYLEHLPDGIREPVVRALRAEIAVRDERLSRLA